MRIRKLHLRGFRGMLDLELSFPEAQSVVFIGPNGAGKTGVLDCVAILLSRLSAQILSPTKRGRQISLDDITIGESVSRNKIEVIWDDVLAIWDAQKRRSTGQLSLGDRLVESAGAARGALALKDLAARVRECLDADEDFSVPLLVYYPVNRAVLDIPLRIRKKHQFDQVAAYDKALEGEGARADFRVFFEWFRNREDYENERVRDDWSFRDRQLEAVRKAVEALIPGFSDLRVRRKPLRMTVRKGREELLIKQLSDGEKCLLAMVGDLARRLAIANPALDDPLKGDGVVLIDEIELHLHPSWQRQVIPALERTFPKCQFLVTTHSPAVLGHIQPDSVFLLERTVQGVKAQQLTTLGQDANRLLEEVFDVPARPKEFEDSLRELFARIDEDDLQAAQDLATKLRSDLGRGEPELAKAEAMMRRKEILGR